VFPQVPYRGGRSPPKAVVAVPTDRVLTLGILFSEALAAEGAVVFAKPCELGLEGRSCRNGRAALYKSGPSRNWLKTKNQNFVRT